MVQENGRTFKRDRQGENLFWFFEQVAEISGALLQPITIDYLAGGVGVAFESQHGLPLVVPIEVFGGQAAKQDLTKTAGFTCSLKCLSSFVINNPVTLVQHMSKLESQQLRTGKPATGLETKVEVGFVGRSFMRFCPAPFSCPRPFLLFRKLNSKDDK